MKSRVRTIELRNDLSAIMEDISLALPELLPSNTRSHSTTAVSAAIPRTNGSVPDIAFALVDGVAPNSPAAQAVCSYF